MRGVVFAVLAHFGAAAASTALAGECRVMATCEGMRCRDVPGMFVQTFEDPPGMVGIARFFYGSAYFFATDKDVVPAIRAGQVPREVRFVVWPDQTRRLGDMVDAVTYGVKQLRWEGDTPMLSKETSLMACADGHG